MGAFCNAGGSSSRESSTGLSNCQDGPKSIGYAPGCGQTFPEKLVSTGLEEGVGNKNANNCSSCGGGCENHDVRNLCNSRGEGQVSRTLGAHLEYGKHFEAGPKPLLEPGGLVQMQMPEPGTMKRALSRAYKLDLNPIGSGSYGEVYGATHRKSGARRAVKSISKEILRQHVKNVNGFIQGEIACMSRLDHPNIVRIYESYDDEEQIDLVLELCTGGDLLERLSLNHPRLPEAEAAELFGQMFGAIQHLYLRGVMHRDLKPEKFLFTNRDPERDPLPPLSAPVKLIDFGLSKKLHKAGGTGIRPVTGSAEYIAPEAFAGSLTVSATDAHRADMWSMGVMLHIAFVGHFPATKFFDAAPDVYFADPCFSNISSDGIDLLSSLLRKDPHKRPTVSLALHHPWFLLGKRLRSQQPPYIVPAAVHCWKKSTRLRHLALAAAARDIDDGHFSALSLRQIFLTLELQCAGVLTRPALKRASQKDGNIAMAAFVLHQEFALVDIDGSDAIDWTEFVAAALSVTGMLSDKTSGNIQAIFDALDAAHQSNGWHEVSEIGFDVNGDDKSARLLRALNVPCLTDTACRSAFDLFAQGTGHVSASSLGQLLAPSELNAWLGRGEKTAKGARDASTFRQISEFENLVKEVNSSGMLNAKEFITMVRQGAKPRRTSRPHIYEVPDASAARAPPPFSPLPPPPSR